MPKRYAKYGWFLFSCDYLVVWTLYIYNIYIYNIYIYIYLPTLYAFLKMSHIKIKGGDIHKVSSYISTLYESSTE